MSVDVSNIINNKSKKSYWIHRTRIETLFINFNATNNGQPVLLTKQEYMNIDNATGIEALPIDFWQNPESEQYQQYFRYLVSNGITKEIFLEKTSNYFTEQLQNYFNNGLYSQRLDITTTATQIDDDESKTAESKLEKVIGKTNFGFVAGKTELAALSNRGELNLLFVLEIPKDSLELGNLQMLFEQTNEVLEIGTAYFGIQVLDKVIPSQYIKCAIISTGNGYQVITNPRYNSEYHIQTGVYDESKLDYAINELSSKSFDYDRILEMIKKINNNFRYNKSYLSYKTRTNKLLEMIYQNFDIDDRNAELYDKLLLAQEKVRKSMRTPLETVVENFTNEDLNSMNEEEIVNLISKLLSVGTDSMNNNICDTNLYFNELEAYKKGIELINESVLRKISDNQNFNDIVENVDTRRKLIEMFYAEQTINYELISERFNGETIANDLSKRETLNDNRVYFIKKALANSDINVVKQIIYYMNTNDVSSLNFEECNSIINSFGKDLKLSDEEPEM